MLAELITTLSPVLSQLTLAAIAAGLIAGLLGLGGGIVIVPAVFFVLSKQQVAPELAMPMAVATSMATIVVTGFSSAVAHHKHGNIDWPIVRTWVVPLLFGVLLGSLVIAWLRTPWLIVLFGVFLMCLAAYSGFKLVAKKTLGAVALRRPWQWVLASVIGFVSALMGIGGGSMSVPSLQLMGLDAHRAVGTSAAMGVVMALGASACIAVAVSGVSPSAYAVPVGLKGVAGLVYWPALIVILPLSVLLAPLGAALGKKMPSAWLARLFLLMLLGLAANMLRVGITQM